MTILPIFSQCPCCAARPRGSGGGSGQACARWRHRLVLAQAATWFDSCELVDMQLTVVCAESQNKRRERHDSVETLMPTQLNVTSWTKLVVMSNQEPVQQDDISFNFNNIHLWYMISVRAPALPHDPARNGRETMFGVRAWPTPPINKWLLTILASPMPCGGAVSHALKFWRQNVESLFYFFMLSNCFWLGFRSRCTQFTTSSCNWLHRALGFESYRRCRTGMWSLLQAVT